MSLRDVKSFGEAGKRVSAEDGRLGHLHHLHSAQTCHRRATESKSKEKIEGRVIKKERRGSAWGWGVGGRGGYAGQKGERELEFELENYFTRSKTI